MPAYRAAVCVALAGSVLGLAAASVRAQDSVSTSNGLPGDASSAYQATSGDSREVVRYIVDLAPKTSSWGGRYAVGPVVKASKSSAGGYFDQLIGAQSASARFGYGALVSNQPYALWTNSPGAGVNTPANSAAAQSVSGAGLFGQRFALGFMEFGAGLDGAFGTGDDENDLIGASVNFLYRQPNRLFVQRVVAATNKPTAGAVGTASFGMGAIDENGNLHAYADGFGMTSSTRLQTRALLRFKLTQRNANAINSIQGSGTNVIPGDAGATDTVRTGSVMDTVPAAISANLPGGAGRPVLLSSDLLNNLVYESGAGTTSTSTSYLPVGSSPRGSVCFDPVPFDPVTPNNGVGTGATLIRTDGNTKTRAIQVFGVTVNGTPTSGPLTLTVPLPTTAGQIIDRDDNFAPDSAFAPITSHEFTNYASQASFRGGNSQVALTVLGGVNLVVAATVAATGGGSTVPQSQDNYIAVAIVPPPGTGAPTTWTIAAHTGASGFAGTGPGVASKTIYGRATPGGPLAPIGRLAKYTEVYGLAGTGPSISSPALDRAGNVYFMATIGLTNGPGTTFTTGLLRANFDGAAYKLELLASAGDVLPGLNSGKNYQIQFLGVADADSVDSGTIFSGATVQDSIAGGNAASVPYSSPMSLGALVFRAKIVYDMNGDTLYTDPSGPGSGSTSPDQAYNVALVLMPRIPKGDFNRDQQLSVQDIFDFLAAWFGGGVGADWNGDGAVSVQDIFDFLQDWFAGG